MRHLPDVIGREIEFARTQFQKNGIAVLEIITAPPWTGQGEGKLRVVRQKLMDEKLIALTVCYDSYRKIIEFE